MADALLIGAESGDEKAVERALNAGIDPNQVSGRNGFTPLHHGFFYFYFFYYWFFYYILVILFSKLVVFFFQ